MAPAQDAWLHQLMAHGCSAWPETGATQGGCGGYWSPEKGGWGGFAQSLRQCPQPLSSCWGGAQCMQQRAHLPQGVLHRAEGWRYCTSRTLGQSSSQHCHGS